MDQREVLAAARRAGVKLVRFGYCDVSGVARAKAVHVSQLAHKLTEGVGLTRAQMSISLLEQVVHIDGMEPVGEIRLVPDPATFTRAAVVAGQRQRAVRPAGPRPAQLGRLPAVLPEGHDRPGRGRGHHRAGHRSRTSTTWPGRRTAASSRSTPPSHAPVYSSIGHDLADQVMIDTVDALEAQGITVEQAINEYGPGQREIAVRHTDALGAADQQMKFRDTVRGVALQHGLYASFAPKPYPDAIGSGAHVHFSLWDTDGQRNLLYDPAADRGMSRLGRQFIAGVAEHLPALVALTAPSCNSYRRLQPSAWASATTAWGFDNKEAALRVASPFYRREEQSYNIEFKSCDASANPYLALGALIAAGVDGVDRELDPGAPAEHDPARMSPEELERSKVRPLPASMGAALDELEKDELLLGSLGDLLGRCYLAVRRSEAETFAAEDTAFELRQHFYRF